MVGKLDPDMVFANKYQLGLRTALDMEIRGWKVFSDDVVLLLWIQNWRVFY